LVSRCAQFIDAPRTGGEVRQLNPRQRASQLASESPVDLRSTSVGDVALEDVAHFLVLVGIADAGGIQRIRCGTQRRPPRQGRAGVVSLRRSGMELVFSWRATEGPSDNLAVYRWRQMAALMAAALAERPANRGSKMPPGA
jgi:hypothetical protein